MKSSRGPERSSLFRVINIPYNEARRVDTYGRKGMDIMGKTFELGNVVATRAVWELMNENEEFKQFISGCLSRYILYDWGDTCQEDWQTNNDAVKNGERVLAVYNIPIEIEEIYEESVWIITEWDRSATTILFPSDY